MGSGVWPPQFSCQLLVSNELTELRYHCRGWDQTGSNGANLSFPTEFGIDSKTGVCIDLTTLFHVAYE